MGELLSDREIECAIGRLDKWLLQNGAIEKWFKFESFTDSIRFVNLVADLAEAKNHHPDINIRYRNVEIVLSTHSQNAVTILDTELAAAIDSISIAE
tara:strand:- start:27 stop:317 length:291 start_codon:yes stop_codon:yes gene_type:complete